MELNKRDGENNYEYHRRLVYGKLVDKTLADVDYTELAQALYGQPYSPDVARRMVYGSKRTIDAITNDIECGAGADKNSEDILREIDAKRMELQKERQRFLDQRREYNKLVSYEGRKEYLEDRLVAAAENLTDTIGAFLFNAPKRTNGGGTSSEAVVVLCDWHYGMTADNIWNKYDTKICAERLNQILSAAYDKMALHGCRKLHIAVLGDLIHGAIHTGTRVASEELVCDQLMNVSEILAQSILFLSSNVDETHVYVTYGNHARTVQNKQDSVHRDNMERIIPWWLKQRLKDVNDVYIHDESDNEFIYMDVAGYGVCASHGDLDSLRSSPKLIPSVCARKYNKSVDCILLADKHHRESIEELGVTAMVCDGLCGTDDYANSKRLYSTPAQTMLIFTQDVGLDGEYHLRANI